MLKAPKVLTNKQQAMLANNGRHIGRIARLQGVHGQLLLVSENILPKDVTKTEWVFLMIDGLPVPFRILEASIRNENSAILTLENYNTPEESRELIGDDVFIESKQRRKSNTSVPEIDEINGYLVIDRTKGKIGLASEVFDFDGNLVLQVWQNKTEILIPVDESIILGVENSKREIYIDAPEGLIDLYL